MSRLTKRNADGTAWYNHTAEREVKNGDILDKLAHYEDLEEQGELARVVHGYWVYDPNGMDWGIGAWRCSECRCRNANLGENNKDANPHLYAGSKYCPNCGAKMRRRYEYEEESSSTV